MKSHPLFARTLLAGLLFFLFFNSFSWGQSGWIRHYSGKLGGNPIEVDLIVNGDKVEGYIIWPNDKSEDRFNGKKEAGKLLTDVERDGNLTYHLDFHENGNTAFEVIQYTDDESKAEIKGRVEVATGSSLQLNLYQSSDSIFLYSGNEFPGFPSPSAFLSIRYADPIGGLEKQLMEKVQQKVRALFFVPEQYPEDGRLPGPEKLMEEHHTVYAETYQGTLEDFDTSMAWTFNWERYLDFTLEHNANSILSFTMDGYEYTGGAHGQPYMQSVNIDLTTGEEIMLADVLKPDEKSAAKLSTLLEKQFREDAGIGANEKLSDHLFIEEFTPTANFCITASGLGFMYNVYEIGPYSAGPIYIQIPWDKLTSMMQKDSPVKRLMK